MMRAIDIPAAASLSTAVSAFATTSRSRCCRLEHGRLTRAVLLSYPAPRGRSRTPAGLGQQPEPAVARDQPAIRTAQPGRPARRDERATIFIIAFLVCSAGPHPGSRDARSSRAFSRSVRCRCARAAPRARARPPTRHRTAATRRRAATGRAKARLQEASRRPAPRDADRSPRLVRISCTNCISL